MKRWLCLLLLVGTLSGCSLLMPAETASTPIDAAMKTVDVLADGSDSIRLRGAELDGDELFQAMEAVWPYAFTMGMTVYGDGTTEVKIEVADQARQEQAATLARGMAEQATEGLTDEREKLRALHDALVRHCVYDVETAENESSVDGSSAPFTAYGALIDGKAVCAGYARAFVLLCQAAGLDAIYVADDSMNHGWNAVRVDGQTYFIDCTFDDPVPDQGEYVSDDYFMLTTEQLQSTHVWDAEFYERVMDAKWGVST